MTKNFCDKCSREKDKEQLSSIKLKRTWDLCEICIFEMEGLITSEAE
jgi:hypothetical protein